MHPRQTPSLSQANSNPPSDLENTVNEMKSKLNKTINNLDFEAPPSDLENTVRDMKTKHEKTIGNIYFDSPQAFTRAEKIELKVQRYCDIVKPKKTSRTKVQKTMAVPHVQVTEVDINGDVKNMSFDFAEQMRLDRLASRVPMNKRVGIMEDGKLYLDHHDENEDGGAALGGAIKTHYEELKEGKVMEGSEDDEEVDQSRTGPKRKLSPEGDFVTPKNDG